MKEKTPPSPWLGLVVVASGAVPIWASLFADDAQFHGPRWLVGMIGGMFVLAGVLVMRGAVAARGEVPDVLGALLGALVSTGFLVLSVWALFLSGGPRAWGVSGSLPFWLLPAWVTDLLFYLLMGLGVAVCAALTFFAWRQLGRAVGTAVSGPAGPRGLE